MKTKSLYFIFLVLLSITLVAQSEYTADRYFKEFNYPKAVKMYISIYNSGNTSELVISRIADSYYYNVQTEKAAPWYKLLIEKYPNVDSEYLFRYAQVLKSNGEYELSDKYMLLFKNKETNDNRSEDLTVIPDYVEVYSRKSGEILSVNNVATNTKYSDFGGFGIDSTFYFASSTPVQKNKKDLYVWNSQPYLDIYKSSIIKKENNILDLEKKELLPFSSKTKYHESNAVFTKDGKTMYFTRNSPKEQNKRTKKDKGGNLKLCRATYKNGKWTDVVELPFNSDTYAVGHPALSPDEKTLYFISDMPGGYGYTDIYKVSILPNFNYNEPINLGKNVNTKGREMFPFVSSNNVLYFSSDGHLGLGALDIFKSVINNDGSLEKAGNIKAPFNSKLDDFGFWLDKNRKKGFFSSNRKGGKGDDDIYSFVLSKPMKNCEQLLTGLVTDTHTKMMVTNATIKLLNPKGKVVDSTKTDSFGMYKINIDCNTHYKITASKKDYRQITNELLTDKRENTLCSFNIELTPFIIQNEIKINPIFFDLGKDVIRDDAAYELENIVTVLKNNPDMRIRIESHTDSRSSRSFNRDLSDRRAKNTRNHITSRGISPERIVSAIGYGEDRLLNDCDDDNIHKCTDAEHQKNRRSYFYIVNGGENVKVVKQQEYLKNEKYHYVKKGENLFRISLKYDIPLEKLKKWNNLTSDYIIVNQRLRIVGFD